MNKIPEKPDPSLSLSLSLSFPGRFLVLRSAADRQVVILQTNGRSAALDGGRRGGKEGGESLAGK